MENNPSKSVGTRKFTCFCKGWLFKKGRVAKNWKRRWFMLSQDTLHYYKSNDDSSDWKGAIDIDQMTLASQNEEDEDGKFYFMVKTKGQVLELYTDSDEARLRWMDAILSVSKMQGSVDALSSEMWEKHLSPTTTEEVYRATEIELRVKKTGKYSAIILNIMADLI
jgi:hypothetical protein